MDYKREVPSRQAEQGKPPAARTVVALGGPEDVRIELTAAAVPYGADTILKMLAPPARVAQDQPIEAPARRADEGTMAETPLAEQVAIVTGASHGIGEAIARKLAELGAEVVLAARNRERLEEVARGLTRQGGRARIHPVDLREPAAVEELVHEAARGGRLDILVNNAGIGGFGEPLHDTPPARWDAIMETNLRAVYLAVRAAVPYMIQRQTGHIVNISSLAAHNPVPGGAAYAASKWALNGLTYSIAEELRGYGIRASVVCPGSVDTDLVPDRGKDRRKMLRPEDVAHAVAMLVTQAPQSFVSEVLLRPTLKP